MTVNLTLTVALAIVCHAFVGRLQAPAAVVNAVAWLVVALTLLVLQIGLLR
jgi:uncharacterized membrane protein (GlpM family)